MIFIEKDKVNTFCLELSGTLSGDQQYFLFEFIQEFDLDPKTILFTTPDVSTDKSRYNKFLLTESSSGATASAIDLPLKLDDGQYSYNVYASISPILQITGNDVELVESGRMLVYKNITI